LIGRLPSTPPSLARRLRKIPSKVYPLASSRIRIRAYPVACTNPKPGDNQPSQTGPLVYLNVSGRLDEALAAVAQHGGKVLQSKHPIARMGFVPSLSIPKGIGLRCIRRQHDRGTHGTYGRKPPTLYRVDIPIPDIVLSMGF
jgi:hypothetical protein